MVTTKPAGRLLVPLVCRSLSCVSLWGVMKVNLLLVLLFARVFNWPIFRTFYRILSALEHVKAGLSFHSPGTGGGPQRGVLPFTFRYLLNKALFALLIPTGSLVSYAMLNSPHWGDLRHGHDAEHHRDQQRGGGLLTSTAPWCSGSLLTGLLPVLVLLWVKIEYPCPWYKGLGLRLGSIALSFIAVSDGGCRPLLPGLRLGRAQQQVPRQGDSARQLCAWALQVRPGCGLHSHSLPADRHRCQGDRPA